MKKADEEIELLKNDKNYLNNFSSVFVRPISDEKILVLAEEKVSFFTSGSDAKKSFLEKYEPYKQYDATNYHRYMFTYPDLATTLRTYNCPTLNTNCCYNLKSIKSDEYMDSLLNLNRFISLSIAQLLMKKDTYTIEELYEMFIRLFPDLTNFSLLEFKEAYKNILPSNGLIKRDYNIILVCLSHIQYLKDKYLKLITDCLIRHDEELINYLRKLVLRYLRDIRIKENIANRLNMINFDYYLDLLLFRDTLLVKTKKLAKK